MRAAVRDLARPDTPYLLDSFGRVAIDLIEHEVDRGFPVHALRCSGFAGFGLAQAEHRRDRIGPGLRPRPGDPESLGEREVGVLRERRRVGADGLE